MKLENTAVMNMDNAIRGMRNPLASWDKSDSYVDDGCYILGEKDMGLAIKLIKGGTEHRKFLRQVLVSVDITAPIYWWKEFDTYKVGTTANSTSTMHKMTANPISWDMFEFDDFPEMGTTASEDNRLAILQLWANMIENLEQLRQRYKQTEDKFYWKEMIRILPEAWLQTRTVTMNYENLLAMYYHRRNHKLTEWHRYCEWIETLPYAQILFGIG